MAQRGKHLRVRENMKYIKFELQSNGDGTYTPKYFDADDGVTLEDIEAQKEINRQEELLRENPQSNTL